MQLPQCIYDVTSKMKNKWEWGNILLTRYTKNQIIQFLLTHYVHANRKDKETIVLYLSLHAADIDINTFVYDEHVKNEIRELRSKRASDNTVADYLNKLSDEERKMFIDNRSSKMKDTRRSKNRKK